MSLIRPFSIKEIKEVMFRIDSNKSPSLDGFGAGFFKASWNIIGNEFF